MLTLAKGCPEMESWALTGSGLHRVKGLSRPLTSQQPGDNQVLGGALKAGLGDLQH